MHGRDGCRLDRVGVFTMRMRRCQSLELARYYQRLENIEKRKRENERNVKINFVLRAFRRLGFLRGHSDGRI